MHPHEGIHLTYHYQLNIVVNHTEQMKLTDEEQNEIHQKYYESIEPSISIVKSTKNVRN